MHVCKLAGNEYALRVVVIVAAVCLESAIV